MTAHPAPGATIRPQGPPAAVWFLLLSALVAIGGIAGSIAAGMRGDEVATVWLGVLGGLGLIAGCYGLAFRNARLVLEPTGLLRVNWLGIRRRYDAARFGRSVRATTAYLQSGADRLFLLDPNGRKVLALHTSFWGGAGVTALQQHLARLGATATVHDEPMEAREFSDRYPGVLPLRDRRPITFILLTVLATFAAILVIAITMILLLQLLPILLFTRF